MSQTTQSLPEILRSIGTEISCYAHQHHPPVEPARLKSGMETVVMLATQADALADKIRTDQLRKNVRLLCLEIRQTFEPVPSGIAFHDQAEAIHYSRDTFAAAKANGMTDDLDALANMVAVELIDRPTIAIKMIDSGDVESILKVTPKRASAIISKLEGADKSSGRWLVPEAEVHRYAVTKSNPKKKRTRAIRLTKWICANSHSTTSHSRPTKCKHFGCRSTDFVREDDE
jgi:hypothetical protein